MGSILDAFRAGIIPAASPVMKLVKKAMPIHNHGITNAPPSNLDIPKPVIKAKNTPTRLPI